MKKLIGILSVMLLLLGVGSAGATVIGFEEFASGTIVSGPGVFSEVVLSDGANGIIYAVAAVPGPELSGRMSAASGGFSQADPFRADFLISGVNFVSVAMGDYNADSDNLFLRAYDISNALLDESAFALNSDVYGGPILSVTGTNIAYVIFGSTGVYDNSVYFDNLTYNASAVPEPATLLLLGFGLIGMAGLKRRLKK